MIVAVNVPLFGSKYYYNRAETAPVEAKNGAYWKENLHPDLIPVCSCESSYEGNSTSEPQQFEPDGKTVRYGRENPSDRGLCQINKEYHRETALSMGYDIETEKGNVEFANFLYKTQGYAPWSWSKHCHGKE